MSSALIRQALEFVDPEESITKRKKNSAGKKIQDKTHPYKSNRKNKKRVFEKPTTEDCDQLVEENVRKLLALSKPVSDSAVSEKIIERAVKGRPLLDKIEIKKEEEKSILFPEEGEESFQKFEKEYFCS